MAIVEILSFTGVQGPAQIFGSALIAWMDFTDPNTVQIEGGKIIQIDDKNGGVVYGESQGNGGNPTYVKNPDNGLYCYDPRETTNQLSTWFRMYNFSGNGSRKTIIYIGKRLQYNTAQIVGTHGSSNDSGGMFFSNSYHFGSNSSNRPYYYTPVVTPNNVVHCSSHWVQEGAVDVANWEVYENGSGPLSGTLIYNPQSATTYPAYDITALGQGRNNASQNSTPLVHEVIYISGRATAQQLQELQTGYVSRKYGI